MNKRTRRQKQDSPKAIDDKFFRQMLESVTDHAVIGIDLEGGILSWNTGAEKIFGYAKEEVVGKPLPSFYARRLAKWRAGARARDRQNMRKRRGFSLANAEGWLGRKQVLAEFLKSRVIRLDRFAIFFGSFLQFRLRLYGADVGGVRIDMLRPEKRGRSLERLPPQVCQVLVHRRSLLWLLLGDSFSTSNMSTKRLKVHWQRLQPAQDETPTPA